MSEAMLVADRLTRHFGGLTANLEVCITLERGKLHALLGFVAIEQHPQVLNRWPHTRIIEIDKQRAVTPENIPGVTIAMQTQDGNIIAPAGFHCSNKLIGGVEEIIL